MTLSTSTPGAPRAAGLEAIIFDYGGTLDGDAQHWFDHFVHLYSDAVPEIPPAAIKEAFYAADAALYREAGICTYGLDLMVRSHVAFQLSHLGRKDPRLATRLADAFIADTRSAWDRNRPSLARLARCFRLGVVSNSYGNMPTLLAEADLAPFALILDSAIVGVAKPDPTLYHLAASRLELPPSAILHVGDSWERDVVPAHAVGMRTAWLARPDAATPSEPSGVWRLGSLLDLEATIG